MCRIALVGICIAAVLFVGEPCSAQYMFLDVSGDGTGDSADVMRTGPLAVDIWIDTCRDREGRRVRILGEDSEDFTINSYEFILRASGGAIEWGEYTNLQPSMAVSFKERKNGTDYYNGYVGMEALPPGKYKLGTLRLAVKSGNPSIGFAATTPLYPAARTSFGSRLQGKDGDNTLKFADDPGQLGTTDADVPGDWCDARGLSREPSVQQAGIEPALRDQEAAQQFSITVREGLSGSATSRIQVRTTKPGFLRIKLFDVSGRVVRELMNSRNVPAGSYTVHVWDRGRSLSSGVYFYRVESSEASGQGKLVLVR